ncbi:hypothetical protein BDW02DRAFT_571812 [Decorospora gaudefroyi]|uniref:Uncharacterized protein n=1 Tax=Decorospora gaudefroyi TaxID=184978 RepID=A0A6A5K9I0_9PLEO|nr:hypothetical protein BDW02DRAFT_571812 [Decorospora gaudefroyi]
MGQDEPYFPYFSQPYQQEYTGYTPMPIEQQDAQQHHLDNSQRAASSRSIDTSKHNDHTNTRKTPKRKRTPSDAESDDDVPPVKRPRQARPTTRATAADVPRRYSEVSDNSSVSKPVKTTAVKPGEKPKKCNNKPWVRTNNTTKGETTRTARINQYTEDGPKYKVKDLPHGDWEASNYQFEYSQNLGMHEFKKRTMSARQIHEYITQYPGDNLRIWIQPVASDAARRYASASHSHCRFDKCPMRRWTGKGTIDVGNYRVAFDEKHKTYGMGAVDPYDCTGYAHLYCMERFLDFAYICQIADVKVDTRVSMPKEPKGHFAGAFGDKHFYEAHLAKKFIDAAREGRLGDTHEFADYPVHADYSRGEPKPHDRTLVYGLFGMNLTHRATSQLKQFLVRNLRPGSFPVHRGDMEVKLVDKKIESLDAFKDAAGRDSKKAFNYSAYYDHFHPEINQRIAECMVLRDQLLAAEGAAPKRSGKRRVLVDHSEDDIPVHVSRHSQKKHKTPIDESEDDCPVPKRPTKPKRSVVDDSESDSPAPAPRRSTKRKAFPVEDYSDDDDFEEIVSASHPQQHSGSRSSPRKKQRVDYAEPQDILPQADVYSPPVQPVPGYEPAKPLNPRNASCSALFPPNDGTWSNFDFENLLDQDAVNAALGVNRRKSSTLSNGPYPSALKSPRAQRGARTASFNVQPVTSSKKFKINDPPSRVALSRQVARAMYDQNQQPRRSKRLASKASPSSPSPGKVQSGRVDKRRH